LLSIIFPSHHCGIVIYGYSNEFYIYSKTIIMKRLILFSFLLFSTVLLYAQNVAINNDGSQPHASAALDIKATDKGLLLPRVANPAGAVSNAAEGLLLYNTTTQQPNFFNGTTGREWAGH